MSLLKLGASALIAATLLASTAMANDALKIAGSSTVLPFATIVAEAFGEQGGFKTPVVEGGGTGAGMKKFCEGNGDGQLDIGNASRKINASEKKACAANNVQYVQVQFGYDGIVFASDVNGAAFEFTPSQWYNALAEQVVVNGKLVPNPYNFWNEIDATLPAQEILAFIPGEKHGTREVFNQRVIEAGCKMFKGAADAIKAAVSGDKAKVTETCTKIRADGRVVEIDGDYNETLARLKSNKQGVGVFGLSFYENNKDTLQVAKFQGTIPSRETIANGQYNVSRPLFFYVKKAHIGVTPGLKEFAQFFVSDDMAGPGGKLESYGLVPDPKLAAAQALVNGM